MNLLEHYIKQIHSVEDVSDNFKELSKCVYSEPLLRVDLTYDCYGRIERELHIFLQSEWEEAKRVGYFMA